MKILKANFRTILLILFEAAVGILLFVDPEAFTTAVIITFGIVMLILGVTNLVRYLREKKNEINNVPALITAVVSLALGVFCAFFSGVIISLIAAVAVIYGIILIVSGVYKLQSYFELKKADLPVSKANAVSGIIAVILGIVIAVYPKDAVFSVWMLTGIMMLAEAVIDIIAVILAAKIKNDIQK